MKVMKSPCHLQVAASVGQARISFKRNGLNLPRPTGEYLSVKLLKWRRAAELRRITDMSSGPIARKK
jgi:hypothetical protein